MTKKLPAPGYIKACGITTLDDALHAADAGVDAIGLNLWPKSPRFVPLKKAQIIAQALRAHVQIVTVTVDATVSEVQEIIREIQPHWLQMHGHETQEFIEQFQPDAFCAVGLANDRDVERAINACGAWVLIDAKDEILRGGTGKMAPSSLAKRVIQKRPTLLAGGIIPENVYDAICDLQPYGIDVASGIEKAPGQKDRQKLMHYVEKARSAFHKILQTS